MPRPLFTPGKIWYPLYRRLVGPQPVWTGAGNLAHTGIRSPDRPARSQLSKCKILMKLFMLNCVFVCCVYDDTIQAEVVVLCLLVSLYIS
jgi:hypothetical protein